MKKLGIVMLAVLLTVAPEMKAIEFGYDAGAELVSSYLWRGQYNGGLSLQPCVAVGFDTEKSSLRVGAWGSVGLSDWKFQKGLVKTDDYNPNTYFVPELDVYVTLNLHGLMLGVTHYYYCDGGSFFNWKAFNPADGSMDGSSQTEATIGIDLRPLCEVPLSVTWNTMVAGNDLKEMDDGTYKRAYSTYIEAKYDQPLPLDMTLSLAVGISPWKSEIYNIASWNDLTNSMDIKNFAVNNLMVRLEKSWELDVCSISLFGQGMLNTCGLKKETVFKWAAGDDKISMQKLNGCIGLGVWF